MPLLRERDTFMANKVVLFNKPFGVVCQFSGEKENLSNYINIKNIYPAGRLDKDSEGLVVLTDDGKLQHQTSHPKFNKMKTYLVQVEGQITSSAIDQLCKGVILNDGPTKPAKANKINEPKWLWRRDPPIRSRKNIPTSWFEIKLSEGRNRQVRRMSASVGFPTLRLIRTHIGEWSLGNLAQGEYK
jgi:23S rRNA pseudouridine2457 synthase